MAQFVAKLGYSSKSEKLVNIQIPKGGILESVFLISPRVQPVLAATATFRNNCWADIPPQPSRELEVGQVFTVAHYLSTDWPDQTLVRPLFSPQALNLDFPKPEQVLQRRRSTRESKKHFPSNHAILLSALTHLPDSPSNLPASLASPSL